MLGMALVRPFCRDTGLAWNACLAQPAYISLNTVAALYKLPRGSVKVIPAFGLIVTPLGDRSCGASLDAFAAFALREIKAILTVIRVWPPGWLNGYCSND